ncbi:hypothetical protein M2650_15195 [Luteimonas sp. SX5]|uniref:DUF1579 domain-containing protein n=1 Tax=Luteimonas galliterrae TaxID=2940486 RepID=A0ABT0MMX5_9GAMM|nr:hypothetical protein [Luteimonas galliterrae]MCL1635968.1 hypothetical protein [Luteimonas galliterrae]
MPLPPPDTVAAADIDIVRRRLLAAAGGAAALPLPAAWAGAPPIPTGRAMQTAQAQDGRHDFDFYLGRWHVRNQRLKQRFVGIDEWETYEATDESRPILGGLGSIDDCRTEHFGGGFRGMAIRIFDPKTRLWRAYWSSNRTGTLDPPVVGGFKDGIGTFYGIDKDGDRAVRVRCLWSEISAAHVKWEQAFSIDEGGTWETNLVMHMTRIG